MIQKWQVYKEKFPEEIFCVQENKGNFTEKQRRNVLIIFHEKYN